MWYHLSMTNLGLIVKNNPAFVEVSAQAKNDALRHAYLFLSPDKLVLKQLCLSVVELILNDDVKVKSGTHPDFVFVEGDKNLKVEDVAFIASDVFSTPLESDKKVILILDASAMTADAQNKLLKTIEEPPAHAIIILGASNEKALLPTILSRVNKIEVPMLTEAQIERILCDEGVADDLAALVASCAGGNLTRAKELAGESDFSELFDLCVESFSLNSSREILTYVSKINVSKMDLVEFFDLSVALARDLLMIISGNKGGVFNRHVLGELERVSGGFNYASLTRIVDLALGAKKDLALYANAQAVLDEYILKMVEVKVSCRK